MLLGVFFLPIQLCAPGSSVLLFFRGSERETQSDTAYQFFKQHPQTGVSGLGVSACRKSLFAPLNKFSELYKSSENLGFQWRRTPFLGFPRTPFLTVAENLSLYWQSQEMSVCFCTNAEEYLTKERKSNIIVPVLGSTMFCDDRLAVAFLCGGGELSAVRTAVRL